MLTPAAAIDTDQRLIITYRSQLDADSQDGATLTNVAGAIEWFDDESSNPDRVTFTRDADRRHRGRARPRGRPHASRSACRDYLFEKTVANVTTGADPATTASPGDRLRYRLRIENREHRAARPALGCSTSSTALNTPAVFAPGTLTLVTVPAGADASNTNATGGANGTGVLDVRNLSAGAGRRGR